MALQIWLPFTDGTLKQQGLLNNISLKSATTPTYITNGKLGRALSGGKIYIPANLVSQVFNNNTMSMAFWYNNNTSTSSINHSICGFNGNGEGDSNSVRIWDFFNYPTSNDFHWSMNSLGGGVLSNVIPANTWVHICVTWNNPTLKIYINGELRHTSTGSSNYTFDKSFYISFGSTYQLLNDFRIYNNCLLPSEVKRLARGLILHYPLNNFDYGNPTLLTDYDTSFQSYSDGSTSLFTNQMDGGTLQIVSNIAGASKCMRLHSVANTWHERVYRTISISANKTYSLSADFYSTDVSTNYAAMHTEMNGGDYEWSGHWTAYHTPGKWERLTITWTPTSDTVLYYFFHCPMNGYTYVKNIKLEENGTSTPWCPSSYMTGIVERDISGYGNDGTRVGSPKYTSDSPKYSISTHFNTSSYILTPFSYAINKNPMSVAVWHRVAVENDTHNPTFSIGDVTHGLTFRKSRLEFGDGTNNYDVACGAANDTTWHHLVYVYNGTDIKVYQDGALIHTENAPSNGLSSVSLLYLNNFWAGTGNQIISDFRIYVTALSADDVAEIYKYSRTVDASGYIHGTIR